MKKLFALAFGALLLVGAGCTSSISTTPDNDGVSGSIKIPPASGSGSAY